MWLKTSESLFSNRNTLGNKYWLKHICVFYFLKVRFEINLDLIKLYHIVRLEIRALSFPRKSFENQNLLYLVLRKFDSDPICDSLKLKVWRLMSMPIVFCFWYLSWISDYMLRKESRFTFPDNTNACCLWILQIHD